jgi:large subunit ribosomal protein L15
MSFQLNSLQSQPGARRRKLRKGRGIAAGQGASCGFGMRGQKSRSGRPTRPGFEGGQMPLYRQFSIVNVGDLAKLQANTKVDAESLVAAGILTEAKAPLKVLGNGELKVKLSVHAAAFSGAARAKIEAAGGSCELIA